MTFESACLHVPYRLLCLSTFSFLTHLSRKAFELIIIICEILFIFFGIYVLVAEIDKKGKKMRDAEKFDVPVVSEDYLEAVKKGGARLMISQHSIASWGNTKVYHCNLDSFSETFKTSDNYI